MWLTMVNYCALGGENSFVLLLLIFYDFGFCKSFEFLNVLFNSNWGQQTLIRNSIYQLPRIPARNMSVFRSSTVQSIVWTLAITAEVTSLACLYRSLSFRLGYSFCIITIHKLENSVWTCNFLVTIKCV